MGAVGVGDADGVGEGTGAEGAAETAPLTGFWFCSALKCAGIGGGVVADGAVASGGAGATAEASAEPFMDRVINRFTSWPEMVSCSKSPRAIRSSAWRCSVIKSVQRSSPSRSIRSTSSSIRRDVSSENSRCWPKSSPRNTGAEPPQARGPTRSLMPNSVTMRRARSVETCRSVLAPVERWLKTSFSATRPPMATTIDSSRYSRE